MLPFISAADIEGVVANAEGGMMKNIQVIDGAGNTE